MKKYITWNELKSTLALGEKVVGTVTRHESYGIFLDIGYIYEGIIQITDIKDKGNVSPKDYPVVGTKVEAVVLGFKEHGCQVWLGLKPSQIKHLY